MIMALVTMGLLSPVVALVTMASLATPIHGSCSSGDSSYETTVSYSQTYSQFYAVQCGLFLWFRCSRYRTRFRTAYRSQTTCCPGFSGPSCIDINECSSNPCMNGGACSNERNYFSCTCARWLTGNRCQEDINECSSNPCMNGGDCSDRRNYFSCSCASGWFGSMCQYEVNECSSNPCFNGGGCRNLPNAFSCNCHSGWTGTRCHTDVNECSSNPCLNGGDCHNIQNAFSCTCHSGWTGTRCQTDVNECSSNPCLNGGDCHNLPNAFSCTCYSGWTGTRCHTDVNECSSNPCFNGGDCRNIQNAFRCTCSAGWMGTRCQTDVNECSSNPCFNGGDCHNLQNAFSCTCNSGWMGTRCHTETNECDSDPCINGGSCQDLFDSFSCTCPGGWIGTICQAEIDECESGPCQNDGVCVDEFNGFVCDCRYGWKGTTCEEGCVENIDLSERSKKTARILSPNFPQHYPNDIQCYWMVKTAEGSTLSVSFKKFDTELDYDFFSLGTGEREDEEDTTKYLIFKHSGPVVPDPYSFRISGNTMWISFRSDDWDNYSGFEVHVSDISVFDPGNVAKSPFPDARNTACGGTVSLDIDGEETITSPSYPEPYGNYMQCDWIIKIVPGRRIGISFRIFELENNKDYVEIGSGADVGRDLVNGGKLTGYSVRHKAIVIENNVAWIRFTSDPANARRGFSALVKDQPHSGCGGTIDISNDGSIVVDYPFSRNFGYRVNLNCIWKFNGSQGRTLSVIFKNFATEGRYDTVSAGYGSSPAYDGSNYVINSASGSRLPEPSGFDTPSNQAWIYFRSDSSITDRGFKVEVSDTSIRAANFTPEIRPTNYKEPDTNCGGEVWDGSFTTKLAIDSPGGYTYRKFLDCLWEIEIPFGGQIRLFFTQFKTEKNRDIVIVGNGTDTEDNESIFITHSGRKQPKAVLTYATNLWVRFITDFDYEMSGWTMVVEAIPYTNCGVHLSIPPKGSITIGSPNFPDNYNNGETCYYQIIGAPGKRILVNFLEFNTERDFRDVINIGDGCFLESGDILVRNHSGYGLPDPGRYFSRKNAVWMTFQTSEFSDYRGWLINFADARTTADDDGTPCEVFLHVAEERVIEGSVPAGSA